LRCVEDGSFCPLANTLHCPLARRWRAHSQMFWVAHSQAPGGHRLFLSGGPNQADARPRAAIHSNARAIPVAEPTQPTAVRWAAKQTLQAPVTRRRNRDAQKQRTSPSACARLRSLIAALACSGDWNMAPNRPGTCERLMKLCRSGRRHHQAQPSRALQKHHGRFPLIARHAPCEKSCYALNRAAQVPSPRPERAREPDHGRLSGIAVGR